MNHGHEGKRHDNDLCFLEPGKPVAILVDGGFFHKRYNEVFRPTTKHSAEEAVNNLYTMVLRHVEGHTLYRIFYYDCPPLSKKAHNPLTKKAVDFSKTDQFKYMTDFINLLKKKRKVAIRRGTLSPMADWIIKPNVTRDLLSGSREFSSLGETDIRYDIRQKGVDMRIGLDIASLSFKKQVSRIVLVSNDSDFISAAKLARREGVDFILDPLWMTVNEDLHEHVDGIYSTWTQKKPKSDKSFPKGPKTTKGF